MVPYVQRQMATLVLGLFAIPLTVILVEFALGQFDVYSISVFIFLVLLAWLFHCLTVEVTRTSIHVRFGPGLVRKTFALSEVQQVTVVRNHWYNGWGIRRLRHGWLYNVSGFDAVELVMRDGHVNRIGTSQPRELAKAIESARAASR